MSPIKPRSIYKCPKCLKSMNSSNKAKHVKAHQNRENRTCKICNVLLTKATLPGHMQNEHPSSIAAAIRKMRSERANDVIFGSAEVPLKQKFARGKFYSVKEATRERNHNNLTTKNSLNTVIHRMFVNILTLEFLTAWDGVQRVRERDYYTAFLLDYLPMFSPKANYAYYHMVYRSGEEANPITRVGGKIITDVTCQCFCTELKKYINYDLKTQGDYIKDQLQKDYLQHTHCIVELNRDDMPPQLQSLWNNGLRLADAIRSPTDYLCALFGPALTHMDLARILLYIQRSNSMGKEIPTHHHHTAKLEGVLRPVGAGRDVFIHKTKNQYSRILRVVLEYEKMSGIRREDSDLRDCTRCNKSNHITKTCNVHRYKAAGEYIPDPIDQPAELVISPSAPIRFYSRREKLEYFKRLNSKSRVEPVGEAAVVITPIVPIVKKPVATCSRKFALL